MNNQGQSILYGIVGLLLGVLIAGYAANNNASGMMRMMGMGRAYNMMNDMQGGGMSMSMNDMMQSLEGKTGDDFDKSFISSMIVHHQGAIEMAEDAKKSAKHDEIKTLADAIIAAQTKEINDMKGWYKSWYGTDVPSTSNNMMH